MCHRQLRLPSPLTFLVFFLTVMQPDAKSDVLEFTMQAGRKTLVEGVRTSFVPVGGRHHMESERHHMVTYQQIQNREDKVNT